MHSDISGKITPQGYNGDQYSQLLIDDGSGAIWFSSYRNKSDTKLATQILLNHAKAITKVKPKILRTDGGTEFKSHELINFMRKEEIHKQETPPYSPEANGRAERGNRTIFEMARTLLSELKQNSKLKSYLSLWPEALHCAVYINNRILTKRTHSSFGEKTPYEITHGRKPDISNLKIFGVPVKVLRNKNDRRSKMEPKCWNGFHVGYGADGYYRIYNPDTNRVIETNNVTFLEHEIENNYVNNKKLAHNLLENNENSTIEIELEPEPARYIKNADSEGTDPDWEFSDEESPYSSPSDEDTLITKDLNQSENSIIPERMEIKTYTNRYGRRIEPTKPFSSYSAFLTTQFSEGNEQDNLPETVYQAIESDQKEKWIKSMLSELLSIIQNDVFEVVKRPKNKKIVKNKWVFALKKNESSQVIRHKSRLCGKGFTQVKGIDYMEVFSPVTKYETLRFLLAYATFHEHEIIQYDVKTAFLNAELDEEIYMTLPNIPTELRDLIQNEVETKT